MTRSIESGYLDPHHVGKNDEDFTTGFERTSLDRPSFTPGPWVKGRWEADSLDELVDWFKKSIEKGDGHQPWQVNVGPDDDMKFVAVVGNGPDGESNARLIAAAPELYEALQRISDLKDEAYASEPVSREVADVVARNAGRIARAALAKAHGR